MEAGVIGGEGGRGISSASAGVMVLSYACQSVEDGGSQELVRKSRLVELVWH